jgi:hypothetical protein
MLLAASAILMLAAVIAACMTTVIYLLPLSPTPQVVRLTRKEVDSMRKYGLLGSAFLLWAAAISMALAKIIIMLR